MQTDFIYDCTPNFVHPYVLNSSWFTGKERDTESGLDNFGARYDASSMGRFITPDPLPWVDWQHGNKEERQHFADFISNPQNFNMYAYVDNNPTSKTDPTGMEGCKAGDKTFSTCTIKNAGCAWFGLGCY